MSLHSCCSLSKKANKISQCVTESHDGSAVSLDHDESVCDDRKIQLLGLICNRSLSSEKQFVLSTAAVFYCRSSKMWDMTEHPHCIIQLGQNTTNHSKRDFWPKLGFRKRLKWGKLERKTTCPLKANMPIQDSWTRMNSFSARIINAYIKCHPIYPLFIPGFKN